MDFTRQEREVILFLSAVVILGIGINFLLKKNPPIKSAIFFEQSDIGKIDLNSADKDLLMSVVGIGEKLARRIIEYREKQAAFTSIEELKNIKGISNYKYEKIKDYFIVR